MTSTSARLEKPCFALALDRIGAKPKALLLLGALQRGALEKIGRSLRFGARQVKVGGAGRK